MLSKITTLIKKVEMTNDSKLKMCKIPCISFFLTMFIVIKKI